MNLLRIENLNKNFGALKVLSDLNFCVEQGTIHSIVGPNGAGKTTLFNIISGFIKPTVGKVFFDSKEITHLPSHRRAALGIQRSFQLLTIFQELTVHENVRLAIQANRGGNFDLFHKASDQRESVEKAYEILGLLGLAEKAQIKACELSYGEQRYLDIGIAMGGEGKIILLDEPTSGLVHDEIPAMGEVIQSLVPNQTVVLIEHRIEMVLEISHFITVLEYGCVIAGGPPASIRNNEDVARAYLGTKKC